MVQSGDYYNKDTNPIGYITFGVAEIILWLGIIRVSGCDDASHPPSEDGLCDTRAFTLTSRVTRCVCVEWGRGNLERFVPLSL